MTSAVVSSELMWSAAGVTALLDLLVYGILALALRRRRFSTLRIPIMAAGALVWCAIYTWAAWTFWDSCYGLIFPPLVRVVVPLFGLSEGLLLGWLFWLAAVRFPIPAPITVGVLGALQSLPGHLVGIYGRDMLDQCKMLNGVSPTSAIVFGLFEYAFYWAIILSLAWLAGAMSSHWIPSRGKQAA